MKRLGLLFFIFCFSSCKEKYPGFHEVENNLYRKVFVIGDEKISVKEGDYVVYSINVLQDGQSVYQNSFQDLKVNSKEEPFFSRVLKTMVKEDSACYIYEKDTFMYVYHVKIHEVLNELDYQDYMADFHLRSEKKEMEELKAAMDTSSISEWVEMLGVYIFQPSRKKYKKTIETGDVLTVHYKGSLLNGKVFDTSYLNNEPFVFVYGDPGQVLKGFEIAISRMKKGEMSKIILPSYLAFGEEGSSDGSIPPYTPLRYEIELLNIEKNETKP